MWVGNSERKSLIQIQMSALSLHLVTIREGRTFQAADVTTPELTDRQIAFKT